MLTSNSTTSSWTSAPTDLPPGLFPAAFDDDPHRVDRDRVFNYYFLFLALFGVLLAVFLWWVHKRRKRRKEQMRLSGHNALARDMEGWVNTRRWFHGAWRHNEAAAFVRREEGLNEHGEAPPPYEPKSDAVAVQNAAEPRDRESGLAIPLRTLSRDHIEPASPPGYRATFSGDRSRNETQATRPESGPQSPNIHRVV